LQTSKQQVAVEADVKNLAKDASDVYRRFLDVQMGFCERDPALLALILDFSHVRRKVPTHSGPKPCRYLLSQDDSQTWMRASQTGLSAEGK
jgi:hypothetical protein